MPKFRFLNIVILLSLFLAACGAPAATDTPAEPVTTEPAEAPATESSATEAPAAEAPAADPFGKYEEAIKAYNSSLTETSDPAVGKLKKQVILLLKKQFKFLENNQ